MQAPRFARAKLRAARRRIARARTRDIEERLVWIFGSPRSGSTWLLRLLAEHERVVPVNEPLIGLYLGPMLADVVDVDVDLDALDTSNFTLRRLRGGSVDEFFGDRYRDVWQPALAEMVRTRFTAHLERHPRGARSDAILAIQEPNGSQSADVIMAALPRATLVFLLRDGRDVVDSVLAANQGSDTWFSKSFPGLRGIPPGGRHDLIERTARKWLWRTQVVQEAYSAHPGPKFLVRYEELRADTARHLRPLLDGIGLTVDDAQMQTMIERHTFERLPAAHKGPTQFLRAASPGLWRENLSTDEQELLERILGPKLRELGYAGSQATADA